MAKSFEVWLVNKIDGLRNKLSKKSGHLGVPPVLTLVVISTLESALSVYRTMGDDDNFENWLIGNIKSLKNSIIHSSTPPPPVLTLVAVSNLESILKVHRNFLGKSNGSVN